MPLSPELLPVGVGRIGLARRCLVNPVQTFSPYLLGSEFSVADLNVAMIVAANAFAKISLSDKPNLD
jgi:glutathione S-transferase